MMKEMMKAEFAAMRKENAGDVEVSGGGPGPQRYSS